MKHDCISLIVPVYNTENYLEQCLNSLTQQTYRNLQILVVNDGSTDGSRSLAEKMAQADPRIQVICQPNAGVSAARNTGLRYADGEFVMFVDSDDWLDLRTCELAMQEATRTGVDVVLWGYVREYAGTSKETLFLGSEHRIWKNGNQKELFRRMVGPMGTELRTPQNVDSMITAWGKLYRRDVLEGVRFVDTQEIGTEDALYSIQVFAGVRSASYLPLALSHYRKIDLSSLSHSYKPQKVVQWEEMYRRIRLVLEQNNLSDAYEQALNNRICLGLIGLGLNLAEDRKMRFTDKCRELRKILSMPRYRQSLAAMPLTDLPPHWKVFFLFAGNRHIVSLMLLLQLMDCLRKM